MKKLIITTAIVLGMSMTSFADPNGGGLFQRGIADEEYYGMGYYNNGMRTSNGSPMLPTHGAITNQDADQTPIGSGLAVLALLGGAYLIGKKRREE